MSGLEVVRQFESICGRWKAYWTEVTEMRISEESKNKRIKDMFHDIFDPTVEVYRKSMDVIDEENDPVIKGFAYYAKYIKAWDTKMAIINEFEASCESGFQTLNSNLVAIRNLDPVSDAFAVLVMKIINDMDNLIQARKSKLNEFERRKSDFDVQITNLTIHLDAETTALNKEHSLHSQIAKLVMERVISNSEDPILIDQSFGVDPTRLKRVVSLVVTKTFNDVARDINADVSIDVTSTDVGSTGMRITAAAKSNISDSEKLAAKICGYCNAKNAKNVCSGCKKVRYCDVDCQKRDRREHKLDCHT